MQEKCSQRGRKCIQRNRGCDQRSRESSGPRESRRSRRRSSAPRIAITVATPKKSSTARKNMTSQKTMPAVKSSTSLQGMICGALFNPENRLPDGHTAYRLFPAAGRTACRQCDRRNTQDLFGSGNNPFAIECSHAFLQPGIPCPGQAGCRKEDKKEDQCQGRTSHAVHALIPFRMARHPSDSTVC